MRRPRITASSWRPTGDDLVLLVAAILIGLAMSFLMVVATSNPARADNCSATLHKDSVLTASWQDEETTYTTANHYERIFYRICGTRKTILYGAVGIASARKDGKLDCGAMRSAYFKPSSIADYVPGKIKVGCKKYTYFDFPNKTYPIGKGDRCFDSFVHVDVKQATDINARTPTRCVP